MAKRRQVLKMDKKSNTFLKECIKGKVIFQYYRKGNLYYLCENGFAFPVPTSDCGDASFNREDKAMMFMRYIRKELKLLENRDVSKG
jgi:hypothetical protein